MSLLDDVRAVALDRPLRPTGGCDFCDGGPKDPPPHPDCPYCLLHKAVAALEAAEAVLWAIDEDEWHGDGLLSRSLREAAQDLEIAMGDGTDDEALVAALREVPS